MRPATVQIFYVQSFLSSKETESITVKLTIIHELCPIRPAKSCDPQHALEDNLTLVG